MPRPTLPSINKQPSSGGGLLDYIVKPAQDAINAVGKGVGDLDQAVSSQKILPVPGSPTLGDIAAPVNQALRGGMEKQPTQQDQSVFGLLGTAAGTAMGGEEGDTNPEEATIDETMSMPKIAATEIEKPSMPKINQPNALQKMGSQLKGEVRQIRLKPGIGGAQREQAVNETLDRLGFSGSAQEQYARLQPQMDTLNDQIQNELMNNPKQVPISSVKQSFLNNLSDQFRRGELAKPAAQTEIDNYIQGLFDAAQQSSGQIAPDTIDTPTLYQMKVVANGDASSVYKKLMNNTSLTDTDKVVLAGRDALDKAIAEQHPNIKQATLDMSRLYDAAPSLESARFANHGFKFLGTDVPSAVGVGLKNAGGTALQMAGGKTGKIALGAGLVGTGALATLGAESMQQKGNNAKPNQEGYHVPTVAQPTMNSNSIPQDLSDIKPDQNGNYSVANPYSIPGSDGSSLALSPEAYQTQIANLNAQYAQAKLNNPQQANIIQGQIATLQSKQALSDGLGKAYEFANTLNQKMADARQLMQVAGPTLLQGLGIGGFTYDNMRKQSDPKYRQLAEDLNYIETNYPAAKGQLFGVQTTEAALGALNQANVNMLGDYYQTLNKFTGGRTPQGQPVQTQSQLPRPQVTQPPVPHVNTAGWGMQMPPIQ